MCIVLVIQFLPKPKHIYLKNFKVKNQKQIKSVKELAFLLFGSSSMYLGLSVFLYFILSFYIVVFSSPLA